MSRCEACDRGEEKFKPTPNGVFPNPPSMHRPSHFICMNEISDAHYEILMRGNLARESANEELAKNLRLEPGDSKDTYFVPSEPCPIGPFTLAEAAKRLMEMLDKPDVTANEEKAKKIVGLFVAFAPDTEPYQRKMKEIAAILNGGQQ